MMDETGPAGPASLVIDTTTVIEVKREWLAIRGVGNPERDRLAANPALLKADLRADLRGAFLVTHCRDCIGEREARLREKMRFECAPEATGEATPHRPVVPISVPQQAPGIERVRQQVDSRLRAIIRQLACGERPWPLTIWGPPGSGKTCAGLCMCDHFGGWYYTLDARVAELRDVRCGRLYSAPGPAGCYVVYEREWWDAWSRRNLVVLDEIGTRTRGSDTAYDALKIGIDKRHGAPLVLISNSGPDAMAQLYDDRVVSRMAGGTVFRTEGDRRMARRQFMKQEIG